MERGKYDFLGMEDLVPDREAKADMKRKTTEHFGFVDVTTDEQQPQPSEKCLIEW